MISAVVLTKNEEGNIIKCIESLLWCDEIIIVDDFSIDQTINRIDKLHKKQIKIYRRKLNNDFASQRNYSLLKATGDWVLFIDSDEIVSKELQKEIQEKIGLFYISKACHFVIKRHDFFIGKELKFGETGNIKLLRLARRNLGTDKWKRKVHEYWDVKGETIELINPILHFPHKSLSSFLDKINFYSDLHAISLKEENKKSSILKIIIWPTGKFVYNFIFRLGFLDGAEGFIIASMMSFHSFLAWSKVWQD